MRLCYRDGIEYRVMVGLGSKFASECMMLLQHLANTP